MRHLGLSNTDLQVFGSKACLHYIVYMEWVDSVCAGLGHKRRAFEDATRRDKCVYD